MIAFVIAWARVGSWLFESLSAPRALWLLPLALALGFALADFISGTVHWFADTYFDPTTPLLGPLLIEPFREHHRDPLGITGHGFLELSGNSALGTLPLAGAALWLGPPGPHVGMQLLQASAIGLSTALLATNVFHRWAHMPRPPTVALRLHKARLVLPPVVHDLHHRAAYDRSYCVTSGWLNPVLDATRFFSCLERLLSIIGIEPTRDEPVRVTSRVRGAQP